VRQTVRKVASDALNFINSNRCRPFQTLCQGK
jgi:hypothetical protein